MGGERAFKKGFVLILTQKNLSSDSSSKHQAGFLLTGRLSAFRNHIINKSSYDKLNTNIIHVNVKTVSNNDGQNMKKKNCIKSQLKEYILETNNISNEEFKRRPIVTKATKAKNVNLIKKIQRKITRNTQWDPGLLRSAADIVLQYKLDKLYKEHDSANTIFKRTVELSNASIFDKRIKLKRSYDSKQNIVNYIFNKE